MVPVTVLVNNPSFAVVVVVNNETVLVLLCQSILNALILIL